MGGSPLADHMQCMMVKTPASHNVFCKRCAEVLLLEFYGNISTAEAIETFGRISTAEILL
jgi:hypothetical protein